MSGIVATDYLVVGAGAAGMAFTDELIANGECDVVMVDRQDRPGGHWNFAYPFVRLHQASANFGCNSRRLGNDAPDTSGFNAGFYERATAAEIVDYFRTVLEDTLLSSGRVRFLGMTDYVGDWSGRHALRSRLTGEVTEVRVRRRLVDTTYLEVTVPATHVRSFTADAGVSVIPIGELVDVAEPPSGFTVLGAGKTSMDACTWLLENGVDPDRITWVRPNDAWMLDRACVQPLDLLPESMTLLADWVECLARATSLPSLLGELEEREHLFRLDPDVTPTAFRGACLPRAEMAGLRRIRRAVRLGRVRHVGADRIVLERGEVATDPGRLYVDCTASGWRSKPRRPIFEPGRITLQSLVGAFTTCYSALIGYVEATRDDDERNRLCPPVSQMTLSPDWGSFMAGILDSGARHAAEPDLANWLESARVNLTCGIAKRSSDPRLAASLNRWGEYADRALANAAPLLAAPAARALQAH